MMFSASHFDDNQLSMLTKVLDVELFDDFERDLERRESSDHLMYDRRDIGIQVT